MLHFEIDARRLKSVQSIAYFFKHLDVKIRRHYFYSHLLKATATKIITRHIPSGFHYKNFNFSLKTYKNATDSRP